jgi:hypothetical protein
VLACASASACRPAGGADQIERRARIARGPAPPLELRIQLPPDRAAQIDRYVTATSQAVARYADWFGAYPHAEVTISARAPWLSPAAALEIERAVHRDVAEQYWRAVAGRSAAEHPWMVASFAEYSTARAFESVPHVERFFGGFVPVVLPGVQTAPGPFAQDDLQQRMTLALHTLEAYLGWPTMQRVLAAYYERFRFKDATPDDFFETLSAVSGRDVTWFIDQVYRSGADFDYGIERFTSEQAGPLHRTTVVVRRYGEAVFPGTSQAPVGPYESGRAIEILVTFADGRQVEERWDGRGRWKLFSYESAARAARAEIDPGRKLLLDVKRTNNGRTLTPRAAAASRKWTLRWLIWTQDLMLTWSCLV